MSVPTEPVGSVSARPAPIRVRLGRAAEDAAHRLLLESGYIPVARNVRTKYGEIDVVAMDGEIWAFIEVKSRTYGCTGDMWDGDAISRVQQRRLRRLAQWYMLQHGPGPDAPCRFDAVMVEISAAGEPNGASLIRDAF
jgi:putative endonuclease